jgi:hypothetical protein
MFALIPPPRAATQHCWRATLDRLINTRHTAPMMTAQCDTSTRPYVTWLLSVDMVVTYGWIVLTSQNDPFSILKIYDAYALYPNRLNWMEHAMTSLSALFIHAT